MKQVRIVLLSVMLNFSGAVSGQAPAGVTTAGAPRAPQTPAPRVVDLKAGDGTVLKASYFAAARPGPGVLLYHHSNRTRNSWDDVVSQLAVAGINSTVAVSGRQGASGG